MMQNSKPNVRSAMAQMRGHVLELAGRANMRPDWALYDPIKETLGSAIALLNEDPKSEAAKARHVEMCAMVDAARRGNLEAQTELAALRQVTLDLYVRSTSNFSMFYSTEVLAPDAQAVYVSTYRNEVKVRYIGQDGGMRTTTAAKAMKQAYIDLKELSTDEIGYPVRDINLGTNIGEMSQATVDLGFDMGNKVDLLAYQLYLQQIGPFTTTGTPLSRTYIPNSRIIQSNLPTTNLLTVPNVLTPIAGGQGWFQIPSAIKQYCDSWGNIFGQPLAPTGVILIPSSETTVLANAVVATAPKPSEVAEGVMSAYLRFEYLGVNWTLVPDVTLAKGTCFPVLNMPVGHMWRKPGMDQEFVATDLKKNWETRSATQVLNFSCPEPWRVRALQVNYT